MERSYTCSAPQCNVHVLLCAMSTWNPCHVYTLRKRTLGLDMRADRRGVHAGVTSVDGTHASPWAVVTGTWHAVVCASRSIDSLGGTFSLAGEIAGSVGRGTSVARSAAFSSGESSSSARSRRAANVGPPSRARESDAPDAKPTTRWSSEGLGSRSRSARMANSSYSRSARTRCLRSSKDARLSSSARLRFCAESVARIAVTAPCCASARD